MKKFLSLVLCLVLACACLVSCSDQITADDLDRYYQKYNPEDRSALELDFYIIVGEGTAENAAGTVERYINSHLQDKLNTTLDIHFITADEYYDTVINDMELTGEERPDIVLVAGADMFDALHAEHAFANITDFYGGTKFGKLNTYISSTLLDASIVVEQRIDKDNKPYDVDRYYTVPNDHVIGEYGYIFVNKTISEKYNYSPSKVKAMNSLTNPDLVSLKEKITNDGLNPDDYIIAINGSYSVRNNPAYDGFYCNISSYPTVTRDEAFKSAFAVVRNENDDSYLNVKDEVTNTGDAIVQKENPYLNHYSRCMEVIYAINTDSEFRNLLLYGKFGSNYSVDDNTGFIIPETEHESSIYNMDILYTGSVFNALYSEKFNWNADAYADGKKQNLESVLATDSLD